jgi:hypothetical protein
MQTRISSENPFACDRYGFLWETLHRSHPSRHLDYGAYDGLVLAELVCTGLVAAGVGVDVNRSVVNRPDCCRTAMVRPDGYPAPAPVPLPALHPCPRSATLLRSSTFRGP